MALIYLAPAYLAAAFNEVQVFPVSLHRELEELF